MVAPPSRPEAWAPGGACLHCRRQTRPSGTKVGDPGLKGTRVVMRSAGEGPWLMMVMMGYDGLAMVNDGLASG